ncbi:hypothetical protein BSK58_14975 [Paenibacillus odorifer]|nr:hypothetical protein BSK58_14975 [Paenibacillus odorifer]
MFYYTNIHMQRFKLDYQIIIKVVTMLINGLYVLIILASITMPLSFTNDLWAIIALAAAIVFSISGIIRNKNR